MLNFVALDVETANNHPSSICSIGMVKFIDGQASQTFYQLINPLQAFLPGNIRIHGIHQEDVALAPSYDLLAPDILDFIDGLPVVAHNAQFDMSCISAANQLYGLKDFSLEYACSYLLAKSYLKRPSYRLNDLGAALGYDFHHHHALDDAMVCGLIICALANDFGHASMDSLIQAKGYRSFGQVRGYEKTGFRKGSSR